MFGGFGHLETRLVWSKARDGVERRCHCVGTGELTLMSCPLGVCSDEYQMGDANGSIPTVQPVFGRPMWGAQPSAAALNSVVWASQAAVDRGKL